MHAAKYLPEHTQAQIPFFHYAFSFPWKSDFHRNEKFILLPLDLSSGILFPFNSSKRKEVTYLKLLRLYYLVIASSSASS